MKEIKIANRKIGLNQPVFVSAEVGTTCNGDFKTAKKLIDAAKKAGMDAVKFQILDPDDKYSDKNLSYTYTRGNGKVILENIYKMLKQYVMTKSEWRKLKRYADEAGIIMFATPDHLAAVDLMEELDMPAYKIATWDVTFKPMIEKIAKLNKPTIIDLGASNKEEVAQILKIFKKHNNNKIILLHCFHTKNYSEMNFKTIKYLRETFQCLSGFSAPGTNNELDYLALPYFPVYIEKRLTLNRNNPQHHHSQALEPYEMKEYVKKIHELSSARGDYDLKPTFADIKLKKEFFRRIVASKLIKRGEKLTSKNIACRRPYYGGIDAKHYNLVLGRRSKTNLKENEPIALNKI